MKLSARITAIQGKGEAQQRYFKLLLKDDPADAEEVLKLGSSLGRDAAGIAEDQRQAMAYTADHRSTPPTPELTPQQRFPGLTKAQAEYAATLKFPDATGAGAAPQRQPADVALTPQQRYPSLTRAQAEFAATLKYPDGGGGGGRIA